jgi:hypothetical protein
VVLSTSAVGVTLEGSVDDVSSELADDERVNTAAVKRSDTDEDRVALLLPDVEGALDERSDMLGMVEFDAGISDANNKDDGLMLLPGILVGAGEEVEDLVLVSAARAGTPDENGYAGTVKSLGNGGTEGTTGRATVGTAGTAGTCGMEGTAGMGTAGDSAATGDASNAAAADTAGSTGEPTALTMAGAMFDGGEAWGEVGACVFVSWATRFPPESTVAMTSTLTVRTFVGDAAWRR